MDWLKDITKTWTLKSGFILYGSVSMLISYPLGRLLQGVLSIIKRQYIEANLESSELTLMGRLIISPFYTFLTANAHSMVIFIFFIIFFCIFYDHKIHPVIRFLNRPLNNELRSADEISLGVSNLYEEYVEMSDFNLRNALKIQEISRVQDTILHETKNPLSVIKGDLELLRIFYGSKDIRFDEILDRLDRNEKRIESFMDRFRYKNNVERIETAREEITLAEVAMIVQEESELYKGVSVVEDIKHCDNAVMIDKSLFRQAVGNVLRNSSVYMNEKIVLTLKDDEEYLIIEFLDDGPGFSEEALYKAIKPYFSENPLVGNMGLGLYFTDIILKKMDIRMELTNTTGGCVRFYLKKGILK